jgi:putative oxidoreductase
MQYCIFVQGLLPDASLLRPPMLSSSVARKSLKEQVIASTAIACWWRRVHPSLAKWTSIPLRLVVGYGFLAHGIAKALRGYEAFPSILAQIGVPAPHLLGWATILLEILGGIAVLLGAFVALVSVPMSIVLIVAIFTVHAQYGFSSIKLLAVTAAGAQFGPPGYETDLLYLACIAALIMNGTGPLSVDGFLKNRTSSSGKHTEPKRK